MIEGGNQTSISLLNLGIKFSTAYELTPDTSRESESYFHFCLFVTMEIGGGNMKYFIYGRGDFLQILL